MNIQKGKHYDFDYSTKDPMEDKNPDLYKINRLHKSLTADNYLTHAIMLAQNKSLTKEQRKWHEDRMNSLFTNEAKHDQYMSNEIEKRIQLIDEETQT